MAKEYTGEIPDWLDVSRETVERLQHFADMVAQWTVKINLISGSTLPDLWQRHVLDSAQLFVHAKPGATWVDMGSGGGFPAIILAIMARETQPDAQFHLVESDQRKSAFLRKAVTELGLRAKVHAARAESLDPFAAQTITARAMAPLGELLSHVQRHLDPQGRAILPKGARAMEEVEAARQAWSFDLQTHPSRTDPSALILMIENLRHV